MRRRLVALLVAVLAASALSVVPAPGAGGDPYRSMQWGLDQIRTPGALTRTTGAGTTIAVIDTGVDRTHPDLAAKLTGGATFYRCPTADPCGDGSWTDGGGAPHPHGTHVAGIAAAATNNGIGVAGTAPDARILPIKVGGGSEIQIESVVSAIRYASTRAQVINLSLGSHLGDQFIFDFSALEAALKEAADRGVVVVAAAGNDTFPICNQPAFAAGVLCVVASTRDETNAYYTNLGEKTDRLVVTAPGGSGLPICEEDIVSTVPVGTGQNPVCGYGIDHDEFAGTSMAAPHVAGVAALLMAQGRNRQQTLDAITRTARQPLTNVRGTFTSVFGWGIVDADAATKVPLPPDPPPAGYWLAGEDGSVFSFGSAPFHGAANGTRLQQPVVGLDASPTRDGYWLVASDGGIFAFGDAAFYGSTGNIRLNQPIVGMASTPSGRGYWLVASDGGIFAFGDAAFYGSTGNIRLNQPIVGMASTPSGRGYWLVASDGGIFAFGDAAFHGSTGNIRLNRPIVGMAATPTGGGYWFVASDGGIFAFGDAGFHGSAGDLNLQQPVTGMTATSTGRGYWFVAADGGVFTFGDAGFAGSASGAATSRIVGIT